MDEINEKGIKDIIDYYNKNDEEPEESEPEEEAPGLVDLIEEAHKEKNNQPITEKISDTPNIISFPDPKTPADALSEEEASDDDTENGEKSEESVKIQPDVSPNEETDGIEETVVNSENSPNSEEQETDEESKAEDTAGKESNSEEISESDKTEKAEEEKKNEIATLFPNDIDYLDYDDEDEDYHFTKKQIVTITIVTLLVMALVVTFVTVDTGFIGSYKHNFSKNATILLSKIGIDLESDDTETEKGDVKEAERYTKSIKDTVTIPVERAGDSVFSKYRGGIVCANMNYLTLINADGETVWEATTTIVEPILKTAGNYILIAEKGGKKICLYNDRKLVYEVDAEDNILTCNLSSNGDVVAITDKASYKGSVVVYNREGNQIFAWSSGSDNIISADISASSRRVAVSLLNTDSQVKTIMQFFDINKTESYAQVIFEDTILFDIDFAGDTVNAFGDNCIAGVTSSGGVLYDKRFDNAEFVHYGVDEKGNKILLFDDSNIPLINIYSSNATLRHQISSDEIPDFVDIYNNHILYNSGRDIIYGRSGSRQMAKFSASMDIKALMLLDKDTVAAVYSNSIEIVRM